MTPENPHAPSRSTPQKRLAVYLSDVHGGTIARAVGTRNAMTQWKGSIPAANQRHADTFDEACAAFEKAW
jgi:hypothetical protein